MTAVPVVLVTGKAAVRTGRAAGRGSDWELTADRQPIGYVVAVRNQASGLYEDVNSTVLHSDEADACWERDLMTSEAAGSGRKDRYVVCSVTPVKDDHA